MTSSGRGYAARLKFNEEFQLETVSEGGEGSSGGDAIDPNAAPLCPCPLLPDGCNVFETASSFRCLNKCVADHPKRKIGVVLPKLVCQREIQVEEALTYFSTGSTPELPDFISRFGRPFTAKLTMQPNGRHTFEFPPREAKEGGAKRGAAAGKKKATAKRPATSKKVEAPAKKAAAAKKAAPKKKAASTKVTAKKASAPKVGEAKAPAKPKVRLVKP